MEPPLVVGWDRELKPADDVSRLHCFQITESFWEIQMLANRTCQKEVNLANLARVCPIVIFVESMCAIANYDHDVGEWCESGYHLEYVCDGMPVHACLTYR